jgi:adenylate cyclase
MSFRLTSASGDLVFELRPGTTHVLGRALTSDLPVLDPTVSRRHATLVPVDDAVEVEDQGSSNGTFLNGERITRARVEPGDTVTFGQLPFTLTLEANGARSTTPARNVPTIVRQRAVPDSRQAFVEALRDSGTRRAIETPTHSVPEHERVRQRLSLLLEVSKELTRAADVDVLLERIAGIVFQILEVDRFSILLLDAHGDLVPSLSRERGGAPLTASVPLSIARTALEERVAILTDNAPEDRRFGGDSVVMQHVRSAVCAPLVGSEGRPIGVLYADSLTSPQRFGEEDLDFIVAFAGIIAVAIENGRFAERSRHEALVRSNFERYFTPAMAARIASSPEAVKLGGDRRTVAVLFSDIRGFTPIAARMAPDETARLLTEYFTEMVECVFRHGGTLDKFMGDAVMAHWGAPIGAPDDADRALDAAIEMLEALDRLNVRWRASGRPELQVGIGLNYGEVFAGNIGSERRLEFTIIGDTVNLASRLCAWAEGGEILVSDAFRAALTRPFPLQPRSPLLLPGVDAPVPVHRVIA